MLHRVHDARFGSCTFNPGLGRLSRFAPLHLPGGPIPTQYVATTFECAVNETIFHDVPLTAPGKTVGADNIKPLAHSVVEPIRDLKLVPLFTPDLARWNISRAELIETDADQYPMIAQWALAIHQARPDVDGLIWTSKRCDPDRSILLFGDRSTRATYPRSARRPYSRTSPRCPKSSTLRPALRSLSLSDIAHSFFVRRARRHFWCPHVA
ncbi:RES family NAD+ phosphorylase [Sinorhizobium sp. GL28]|uniref:RES family NAD+ phosphorylase n=1 Tax=Sinorhizobium sp. GL28 TaxID=1358418 RepID=UPI0018D25D6C|nr:RES family NAD+ phosphorylase [Sinorhizobium sp. GL28]